MSRDPRMDPQPGDWIRFAQGFQRTVTRRTKRYVHFGSYVGTTYVGPFRDSLKQWREDVFKCEVVHVEDPEVCE